MEDAKKAIAEFSLAKKGRPGKLATHCKRGHELTDETTYIYSYGRRCKQCVVEQQKEWAAKNPERAREAQKRSRQGARWRNPDKLRDSWLRRRYGIDYATFLGMCESQGWQCPICLCQMTAEKQLDAEGRRVSLQNSAVVDHCHDTGKVRGVICMRCNTGIGYFEDRAGSLERAVAYLKRHE